MRSLEYTTLANKNASFKTVIRSYRTCIFFSLRNLHPIASWTMIAPSFLRCLWKPWSWSLSPIHFFLLMAPTM